MSGRGPRAQTLFRALRHGVCAGYVAEDGVVTTDCAPILCRGRRPPIQAGMSSSEAMARLESRGFTVAKLSTIIAPPDAPSTMLCPYDGSAVGPVRCGDHGYPYRIDHGERWMCSKCGAYIESDEFGMPAGLVANATDRMNRQAATAYLDKLISAKCSILDARHGRRAGESHDEARRAAMRWLASESGVDVPIPALLISRELESIVDTLRPHAMRLPQRR